MRYLTAGFKTLALFSLSRDTLDAGSTCSASSMRPDDGLHKSSSIRDTQITGSMQIRRFSITIHFRENNKLQKGSFLLSSSGSMLITLSLIYSKPEKFASGNKRGISCSRVKIVESIFARIKGRVRRPVQRVSLRWWRWGWRKSFKLQFIPITSAPKFSNVFYFRCPWFASMNIVRMPSTRITPWIWWGIRPRSWPVETTIRIV